MVGLLSYLIFFLTVVLIFGIATMGLNLQWGFTGLFNAGVVGFFAIGGYTVAILSAQPQAGLIGNFGLPWVVGLLGAMVVSALAALIIGFATVRLRGDYLAVATFGTAMSIQIVALNWGALTGGSQGMVSVTRPLQHLTRDAIPYNVFFLLLMLACTTVVYVGLERIVRSPWGRVLRALREDETAAIALGKNAVGYRLQAFVVGAVLIGLSGALYVSYVGFVSPADFVPMVTFQLWAMLIVGGSGNNRGALLGSLVVWAIWTGSGALMVKLVPPNYQTQGAALQSILIGLLLVVTLLYRPRGIIGEQAVVSRHAGDD